ncbi:MAG TPA: aminotransferase class IV [Bacteroidota bacterium]|nr:aminotransferase class IV [Bacteroidota bacterium]
MNLKELETEALLKPSPGDYYALVYDRARGNWLQFRDPLECIEVDDVAEVVPAIHRIEESLREKRLYAAGFISYEAASAFDSAFCTKTRRGGLPLLSFSLFASPQPVCMDERMNGESVGLQWMPAISREEHERCVSRIRELIGDGERYKVNYTYRLNSDLDIDPFSFFCAIAGDDPPPHSCFFQAAPFPERRSTAVRLAFSRTPVNSQDRMLYHKTSLRDAYDSALQPAKGNDDLLLRNERGEITETTIANIVLDIDNRLLTPPVFSGLLPGVMRKHLLESGKIAEGVLTKEDVVRAKGIFRINSVRKWEACTLADAEGLSHNSD